MGAVDNFNAETFLIPNSLKGIFKKCGVSELLALFILGKACHMAKKKGHCVLSDAKIQEMIPFPLYRTQIARALQVLKSGDLIKVSRTGLHMHGSRVITPNWELLACKTDDVNVHKACTTSCTHTDTSSRTQDVTSSCTHSDTSMYTQCDVNVHKACTTNNLRNLRNLRIYIERFLLKFYKNNLDQLFKDKDVFRCDLTEAKKTIPFDGGPYEALTDWIYTNIKEWARELLCCKYFYHDHAGRCEFNLEPVLDYALGHYDPSKGVHFLDYFQTVILNNCKILFRKYRDGEDNYIETFGRLFDRLMLQKWLFQKDEKMKLTPTWAEAHYFAFDDKALRKIRRHCREGYDFSGYDIIAKKYIGTKELIIIINAWFIHFCLYRFRYHNDMHDTWRDLFKFTKNEDVFLNASDKEMLDYFASIWGVFNKAYTQFKLPAVTLDETLDAIFKEGE
ncbi:Uncharacterised protein [Anaerobiospirillum thomasii]|nr:Uncharacterised protein [Anaerobiospirillum thomasii]SPT72484.1 Uncharacterised protein [Anaerobiospirillum thomasii]